MRGQVNPAHLRYCNWCRQTQRHSGGYGWMAHAVQCEARWRAERAAAEAEAPEAEATEVVVTEEGHVLLVSAP
jgi:hypothetical protein